MCVHARALGGGRKLLRPTFISWSTLAKSCFYHSCFAIAEMCVMMIEGIDTAPAPANHSIRSAHLRVDREPAVELLARLCRQPLRELLLEHDHGAAEHGPAFIGGFEVDQSVNGVGGGLVGISGLRG